MEIVKIKDLKFGTKKAYAMSSGYAFHEDGKGYLAFTSDTGKYGILTPYIPCGGKKALQLILDGGGFTSLDGMEYVNPMA